MLRRVLAVFVLLVMPLLAACAVPALIMESFGEHGFPSVDETADAYNQDLRWGRLQQAAAQMAPEQREPFFALFDGDPGPFRFTSVEVLSAVPKGVGGREVDVLVSWEFYNPPALTERKLRQKQTWRYLELERRWEVSADLAIFDAVATPARAGAEPVPASPQR